MQKVAKIVLGTTITGLAIAALLKGTAFYNKLKQAPGNINFNVSFSRIHGLVGQGITAFTSPTIRVLFNLNLSNFSGFDVEVKNIYSRFETSKSGPASWSVIAKTPVYMTLSLKDGKERNVELWIDFKGFSTINSLINKTNRHRIVITYEFKGQPLQYSTEIDITGPINDYWQKAKAGVNALKGIESNTLNLIG